MRLKPKTREGKDESQMNIWIVLLSVTLPCAFAQIPTCPDDEQEGAALTEIRNAMNFRALLPTPCCEWEHVTCEATEGRVWHLSIRVSPGLFPDARIPRQVCSFTKLRSLSLINYDHRVWNDEIPPCLEDLSELQELEVTGRSSALFEVPIIPGLKKLNLEEVNLTGASFHRIFDSLKQLQEVNVLSRTLFTTIPDSICSLSNLVKLDLSGNLTGVIPSCLPRLSRLELLSLPGNSLRGTLPYLRNFTELKTLELNNNRLHGPLPSSICNMTSISFLDLSGNHFNSPIPECMTAIPYMYLQNNRLRGELPRTLFMHNISRVLDLSWNRFTGQLPEIGVASPSGVILSNNFLSGTLRWQNWQNFCRYMRMLDLSNNKFTGSIPHWIGNCTLLAQLHIHNNGFQGEIPTTIGSLQYLVHFTSRNNQLTGVLPPSLGNCSYLSILDVANNSMSGEVGEWIYALKLLYALNLGSNHFNGSIPNELGKFCMHLMAINLSKNRFSGTLPQMTFSFIPLTGPGARLYYIETLQFYAIVQDMNLRMYSSITFGEAYLDMSDNNLEGGIPDCWKELSSIGYLDLSRNQLVGKIPPSLGSLQHLQALDLSDNRLAGVIPQELVNIPRLAHFNVSYNDLQGPVPCEAQFSTFAEDSYAGNPKLTLCNSKGAAKATKQENVRVAEKSVAETVTFLAISISLLLLLLAFLACLAAFYSCSRRQNNDKRMQRTIVEGELWNATQGFREGNVVEEGGCSTIYRGVLSNGQTVAVKVFKLSDPTAEEQLMTEYSSLRDLRHRNIVKMVDCCFEGQLKALVFKFMHNRSLETQLHELQAANLLWKTRLKIVHGIANALSYLHEEAGSNGPVVHRDVKPANVLLDQDMEPHLGDFGIAKSLHRSEVHWESKLKGSIGYIPPEYGLDGALSTAMDVYSYGILVLETLTRIRPTSSILKESSLRSLVESHLVEGRLHEVLDPILRDSVEDMAIDGVARIGLLCSHPIPAARPQMGEVAAILRSVRVPCNYVSPKPES